MLLWERVAPSHVGKGGFASIMRVSGLVGFVGGLGWFYSRSIRTIPPCPQRGKCGYRMMGANIGIWDGYRTVLWVYGKQARGRYGYAGDGG